MNRVAQAPGQQDHDNWHPENGQKSLAAAFRLNRYLLLLLAGMLYPWAFQVVASAVGGPVFLAGACYAVPATLVPLAYLYLPPLLVACAIAMRAIRTSDARPEPT